MNAYKSTIVLITDYDFVKNSLLITIRITKIIRRCNCTLAYKYFQLNFTGESCCIELKPLATTTEAPTTEAPVTIPIIGNRAR